MPRTALVVSGGGAKGAFAVGAAERLRTRRTIDFDVVTGTSTGALMAPLALLGNFARLRALYQSMRAADLFVELVPATAFAQGYLLDTQRLRASTDQALDVAVYDDVRAATDAGKQLVIAAVGLRSGKLTYFYMGQAPDIPADRDAFAITSRAELVDAVVCSASQPVVMTPAPFRTLIYCDAGVREYAPVQAAVDCGAEDIYAVVLSPPEPEVKEGVAGIVGTLMRTLDLFGNEVARDDVETPRLLAGVTQLTDAIRSALRAALPGHDAEIDQAIDASLQASPFGSFRLARLFVIHPDAPLLLDSLRFNQQDMNRMIDLGRQKADALIDGGGPQPHPILV